MFNQWGKEETFRRHTRYGVLKWSPSFYEKTGRKQEVKTGNPNYSNLSRIGVTFTGSVCPWCVFPAVDRHGKAAVNWLLSLPFYFAATFMLSLYYQPTYNLFAILVMAYYLFPIIAAVKAYDGKYWKYPLSIPFFKSL